MGRARAVAEAFGSDHTWGQNNGNTLVRNGLCGEGPWIAAGSMVVGV